MRARRVAWLAVFVTMVALCAAPAEAAADQASTLYVNNGAGSNCSDTGVGAQAVPFCTIQAAADVAGPGQTVQIAYGASTYPGEVDLTRSGNQGAPITFTSDPNPTTTLNPTVNEGGTHAFTLTGVHDIVLDGLNASSSGVSIVITDSSRIDLDEDFLDGSLGQAKTPSDGVDIAGQSSAVTISRSIVGHYGGTGISIGTGVTGTVLTTDAVNYNAGYGIMLADATNTVLTSNTVGFNCGSGVLVGGASAGATLENNILTANSQQPTQANEYPCVAPAGAELSVAATATANSTADYNIAYPTQSDAPYSWGGVSYAGAAALQSATGQGAHDLNTDPQLHGAGPESSPSEGSPAIDSANADAPDELATDGYGRPREDDPTVANTGTGPGYNDRGAYEFQDPFRMGRPTQKASGVVYPLQDTVTSDVIANPWSDTVSYTFNFGDGSAPVTSSTPTVTHPYAAPGTFTITVTATLSVGRPVTASTSILVKPPGPLTPMLWLDGPYRLAPLQVGIDAGLSSAGGWTITDYSVNFGDNSATIDMGTGTTHGHAYGSPGTYPVTLTITDSGGRTASTIQQVTVGSVYYPEGPIREIDTRPGYQALGPNSTKSLQILGTSGVGGLLPDTTAVVLNVTVVNPTAAGYLTVYASGSPRPGTSNLNFTAGETVSNLVTVPLTEAAEFYNSAGDTNLVVDYEGLYATDGANNAGRYTGMAPTRVLDTRVGTGAPAAALGPASSLTFQVAAPTKLPGNYLTAVALNVTATDGTAGSYLTAYPGGTALPTASNLNFSAGQTVANIVIVPVSDSGTVTIYNNSGDVDVVVDLEGYFSPDSLQSFIAAPTSTRLLDTRSGIGAPAQQVGPGGTVSLQVTGVAGVPTGTRSVVLNLTATDGTAGSYLTAYPDQTKQPLASALNFGQGQIVSNLVIATVGADGKVDIANGFGNVDIVADLLGYYS